MEIVAKFNSVTKKFDEVTAVNSLSFELRKGESLALLGPNGAGKSTALTILQGLRQPDTGVAQLFGYPAGSKKAMEKVGVTPQATDFPTQVTPVELLELASTHFRNPRKISDVIEEFNLEGLASRQLRGFSGGEKRKVSLALCFVGNPELVILDEPTTGLDAQGQRYFQNIFRQFVNRGNSLILTSHYWQEIEHIADRIIMIDKGKTIMSGKISDIKSAVGLNSISFQCPNPNDFITETFTLSNKKWSTISNNADKIVTQLVNSGEKFSELNISPVPLDEALNIYRKNQVEQNKNSKEVT